MSPISFSKTASQTSCNYFQCWFHFSAKLLDNKFIKVFPSHCKLSAFIFFLHFISLKKKIFSHITLIHCGVLQFNTCHISRTNSHSPPLAIKLEVKIRKLFFISHSMLAIFFCELLTVIIVVSWCHQQWEYSR